ncbi:hypothetical protein IIV31_166R [Armadillidium vulgare iridescent virus]|uniref:Uncharacterized protein n=1 Tax=Armadillidium vulgare iridescent virus TaxID=72201 RepID=A0A068QKZ8_9VIRU|nr:hypothetical protein IIV31_166R [Armadillidium vulgare iridescent virus]CCV02538.1 hypothetical protein IIV31_166R [Armadillidium vulgare iridescent virus]
MDHQTFKENLGTLNAIMEEKKLLLSELKKINVSLKKLKEEEEQCKKAILEDLKQNGQEGVEYKDLKIMIGQKPLRKHYKKSDKEQLMCEALQKIGVSNPQEKTKILINAISQTHTETEDTLKVINQVKKKK